MAVVCVIPEHPVGEGAFCRICGRSYLTVADPVPDQVAAPAPELVAAVSAPQPPPLPPVLPPPLPVATEAAALDQLLPEQLLPAQVIPAQVTSELAADALPEQTPPKVAARSLPPSVVHALAGFGGGAVVMAVLDRVLL